MTTQTKNKRPVKDLIMNMILVILCILLFLFTVTFIVGTAEYNRSYIRDDATLLQYIGYGQFEALLDAVNANEAKDVPVKEDMKGVYAAAHYYENAVLYHAYQHTGDIGKAQARYEKMQEYGARLGEYDYVKDEIADYLEALY